MFCPYCGTHRIDEDLFCRFCGRRLRSGAQRNGHAVDNNKSTSNAALLGCGMGCLIPLLIILLLGFLIRSAWFFALFSALLGEQISF